VPVVRERVGADHPSLAGVSDEIVSELVTTVYLAGLEPHEGAYDPVRVVFAGPITADVVLPEGDAFDASPMLQYRWSTLRLDPVRPFTVSELVKLGVATRSDRMYTKVELHGRSLRIVGITREGRNGEGDPFLKVVSLRPGTLSVRRGDDGVLEYERGQIDQGIEDPTAIEGPVRRALLRCAEQAKLGPASYRDYLATIRAIVRQMSSHGRGGILVVSDVDEPHVPVRASYRTVRSPALGELLHFMDGAVDARHGGSAGPSSASGAAMQLRRVLQRAVQDEVERWVIELGGLTAMDGATVLDCALGVRGFGVVLPVSPDLEVIRALDSDALFRHPYDLSTLGTRHRAAATYALEHPGSVVIASSHDGPISCFLGCSAGAHPRLAPLADPSLARRSDELLAGGVRSGPVLMWRIHAAELG